MIDAAFAVIEDDIQRNELAEFYKENLNRFLNAAFLNVHNIQDAEDAVQEAFSSIADKPERFFAVPDTDRVNYMFIVVRNISIDIFNRKNKVSLEEYDEEEMYDESQISPEDDIIGKISKYELTRFIQRLPPLQRDVLALRCMIGLSIAETADALNISTSAVKERLRLARKAIREFVLKEDELHE